MVTGDEGLVGLAVLQILERRSCTQNELNEWLPDRVDNRSLFPVLCQYLHQGLIGRDLNLPRYRSPYHLTPAGREYLHALGGRQIVHHRACHLDRLTTELSSLIARECAGMSMQTGSVIVPSQRSDLVQIEQEGALLASLVKDEHQRYLITSTAIPVRFPGQILITPLPAAIALPSFSQDLLLIPMPDPAWMAIRVEEINRLLSVRGVLLITLPFILEAEAGLPADDLKDLLAAVPWIARVEEMALVRTLDRYFDVYCLRHRRSALLICRRWGTGREDGEEVIGDLGDPIAPCRVVEVNEE